MKLIGRKFVNKLGLAVVVVDVKLSQRGDHSFVYYNDISPKPGMFNFGMKLPEHTFVKQYKKNIADFKKGK
jgi:hypothetical protein